MSAVIFMVAGAADAVGDWLIMLAGSLIGFCAALCFAMLGVGFVALFSLWKELVLQFRRANIRSLLLSSPLAIFWLVLGLAAMVFIGMLAEKVPVFGQTVFKILIWGVISIAFYRLWTSRSHAGLMLRAILMLSFSGIMVAAAAYAYWWITTQTALLLVVSLSTIGALNVAFYSSSVRLTALKDNLVKPPGA